MTAAAADPPPVSVIIPCRNEAETLGEVLQALGAQTYPAARTEVIVVDNGSTDPSRETARRFGVRLLEEPEPSAYRARNRALAAASGDFLLFLDADTIPAPGWIDSMVRAAMQSETGMAGGRIENRVDRPTLGSALLALNQPPEKRRASIERDGRLSGGNMIVKRSVFDRFGPFLLLQSGADGEFSERANPGCRPIPYVGEGVVTHVCNLQTPAYLGRAFRIARGQAAAAGDGPGIRPPIPWRPGLRRARRLSRAVRERLGPRAGPALLPRVLAVLWLERVLFYFGAWIGRRSRNG